MSLQKTLQLTFGLAFLWYVAVDCVGLIGAHLIFRDEYFSVVLAYNRRIFVGSDWSALRYSVFLLVVSGPLLALVRVGLQLADRSRWFVTPRRLDFALIWVLSCAYFTRHSYYVLPSLVGGEPVTWKTGLLWRLYTSPVRFFGIFLTGTVYATLLTLLCILIAYPSMWIWRRKFKPRKADYGSDGEKKPSDE